MFKILFFGDVVGALGRRGVAQILPSLRENYAPDLIVANVENLAHGAGITAKTLQELVDAGVDAFTGGNHSWDNPLGTPLFDDPLWKTRLVVPTNYGGAKGGSNYAIVEKNGQRIMIVNIMGKLFTHPDTRSPFTALETVLATTEGTRPKTILVDLHAETTAEKEAFGHFADGRVSAVLGTHTHVPTADAKLLPGGTAYVTDVGRCGAHDSVLGYEKKSVVQRFLGLTQARYELSTHGVVEVNAALVTVDLDTGRALALDRIREMIDISAEKG